MAENRTAATDERLTLRAQAFLYCLGLLGYYFFVMWALWRSSNQLWGMYGNIDGMWAAWTVEGILNLGYPFDFSPYNILSGMGSMFPPNLPWLNPGALSLGLPLDQGARYVASYSVYFLELVASIALLMRVIGLSPLRSILAAQVYILVLFPPTSEWFLALTWYSLAPFNAHLAAIGNLALCLFHLGGRYGARGNAACLAGFVALFLVTIVSSAVSFLTYVPIYALMAIAIQTHWPQGRELRWKAAMVLSVAAASFLIGFPDYLAVTSEFSARSENLGPATSVSASGLLAAVREAWERFEVCGRPQELLCKRYPVFWFHILAICGALIALLGNWLRRPAAAFLVYYALVHAWEAASYVQLFGRLHVISVPYLVWAAYPFFALFAVIAAFSPYDLLHKLVRRRPSTATPRAKVALAPSLPPRFSARTLYFLGTVTLVLAIPVFAASLWQTKLRPIQSPKATKQRNSVLGTSPAREPVIGPVTRYLIDHASVAPGRPFRGYTVSYFGDPGGHVRQHMNLPQEAMGWKVHVASRDYLEAHYGNQFQEMDLWRFSVPTFEEYGQWVTKQAHVFATQLLSSPGDSTNGVMLQVYRLDLDLLQALGVRYLVTDLALQDPRATLRAEHSSGTSGPIRLYEFPVPNLATYSPTVFTRASSFSAALEVLRRDAARLDSHAVLTGKLDGAFVPVSHSSMQVERDGFRVKAKSDGRSALLLPVQYSHCLRIVPTQSSGNLGSTSLTRINGIQTLLTFEGEVDIRVRFEFGLFWSTQCRREDVKNFQALLSGSGASQ